GVGMSDTIEAGYQRAREAWLFQRQPAGLIDLFEPREIADPFRYGTRYYSGEHALDAYVIVAGTLGGVNTFTGCTRTIPSAPVGNAPTFTGLIRTISCVEVDHPTGSPAVVLRE